MKNKSTFSWWKHGVIYQVYPRSFKDTNGNGIGDIKGIISKLDYLKDLGITGIWLSPIYESPMFDMGYDISNYYEIDPMFGTMKDFKKLIREAKKRKMYIIMDLVLNHTSHLHPWFLESSSSRDNPKRDWYIWHDKVKDKEPNNWRAGFGGSAWEWHEKTEQYYLHLFLKEQPDLNWRNEKVQKEIFDMIKYWLEIGVMGFRLDVINFIVKEENFKDNPYSLRFTFPRKYDQQDHKYDRNQPETHDILKKFRRLLNKYGDTMSVGEIYPNEGVMEPAVSATYLGNGKDELHLAFNFSTMITDFKAQSFQKLFEEWYSVIPEKGWPCHVLSNHDKSRAFTRLVKGNDKDKKAKLLMAMLLTQRGTPFLYYGEEIGMEDGKLKHKDIVDPVGKKYWPAHPGRDPERTPMLWSDKDYAGFSEGLPWLPVNKEYKTNNVKLQKKDENSILNFTKKIIALRKIEEALYEGEIEFIKTHKDILAYYRTHEGSQFFIALNFSSKKRKLLLDDDNIWNVRIIKNELGTKLTIKDYDMDPYEVLILSRQFSMK